MNISSVLLTTKTETADSLCERIAATPCCSVALREKAAVGEKIIALIEAPDLESGVGAYQTLEKLPNVTSIAMVFAYDDCAGDIGAINPNIAQETLNKEQKAEEITYFGAIAQKL